MRKLVLILIASIAIVTFIRAYDNKGRESRILDSAVSGELESKAALIQIDLYESDN